MDYTDQDRLEDFDFFVSQYSKLFQTYGHRFLAIKNKEILGVFNCIDDVISCLQDVHPTGTYIIQECNEDDSAYRTHIMGLLVRG